MKSALRLACALVGAATLSGGLAAAPALASKRIGTDARDVTLRVNSAGEALVTFRTPAGDPRRVLVWGAVNARPPDPSIQQVRFQLDYTGGRRTHGRAVWRSFADACRPYDGPPLALVVAACKAPDGSFWALQSWQRLAAMRGFAPFRPEHVADELHISHWTGQLPALEISPNWTYNGRFEGLLGRLTYAGAPVFGYRTPSSTRSESHARYVYIDTYNSVYGPGWKRDTAITTHRGNGAFCYSFVPQAPPPGYPGSEPRGPGNGERHRVTVMGPGVTPIVRSEAAGLGPFDWGRDAAFNAFFDRILTGDRVCTAER